MNAGPSAASESLKTVNGPWRNINEVTVSFETRRWERRKEGKERTDPGPEALITLLRITSAGAQMAGRRSREVESESGMP